MTYNLRIADIPCSERPRERLIAVGAKNLATAELLAILIGTGQGKGKLSAVGLGHHILQELSKHRRDSLDVLRDVAPNQLMAIDGIGPAKATTIIAAVELGKRTFQVRPLERVTINSPEAAVAALSNDLMWERREHFAAVFLDSKYRLLGTKVINIGTATESLVDATEIFRETLKQGANALIVAHNHPSGNVEPSQEDLDLTEQLLQGMQLLQIPLIDHLILGEGNHCSLHRITDLWQRYPQE